MERRARAVVVSGGIAVACAANAAASPGLQMEWQAPPGCPDAAQVRAMVGAPSSSRTGQGDLVARAAVTEAAPGRFVMQVWLEANGASETRTLDADDCATLADAYAVIVAFRLDPESAGRSPAAAARAAPPAAPAERPASPPAPRPGIRVGAGPGVATSAGALPFPSYGLGGAFAVEHGVRWEIAGMYWPGQPSWLSSAGLAQPSQTYGARVQLASAQPSVCLPVAGGLVDLCAGAQVGAMEAAGTGSGVRSDSGRSWWLAPIAGVALRLRVVQALDLRFRLDGGVAVFRPTFVLENVGPRDPVQAYRPAPVFAALSLEPEIRFFSTESAPERHVRR